MQTKTQNHKQNWSNSSKPLCHAAQLLHNLPEEFHSNFCLITGRRRRWWWWCCRWEQRYARSWWWYRKPPEPKALLLYCQLKRSFCMLSHITLTKLEPEEVSISIWSRHFSQQFRSGSVDFLKVSRPILLLGFKLSGPSVRRFKEFLEILSKAGRNRDR